MPAPDFAVFGWAALYHRCRHAISGGRYFARFISRRRFRVADFSRHFALLIKSLERFLMRLRRATLIQPYLNTIAFYLRHA